MWKDAWWLVGKELKLQWRAFVSTILVTFLLSLLAASIFIPFVKETFHIQFFDFHNRLALDLVFVGLTPTLSVLFMSNPYLSPRAIKEDPFGKRMAVYRALPIPVEVLSRSRILLMLITLVILSAVFYTAIMTAASYSAGQVLPVRDMIIFILLWFGYAMGFGGLNMYIEVGTNGKILWLSPFLFLIVFLAAAIALYQAADIGIVEWSFTLVRDYGWTAAAVSLLFGVLSCITLYKLLKNRLLKRDYV